MQGETESKETFVERTFFEAVRGLPFLNQETVGAGEPEIGTVIVNVSPTVDCTSWPFTDRHTAGFAKIRQQWTFNFQLMF